jgi:hypothetical protein
MEDPEASPPIGAVTQRLADQIGLSPAGLKENGWKIAADETAPRRETAPAAAPAASEPPKRPRSRFKVVSPTDDTAEPTDES